MTQCLEDPRARAARRAMLQIAGCATLLVAIAVFRIFSGRFDVPIDDPEAPYWTSWQIVRGIFFAGFGAMGLRMVVLKRGAWGLPGLACLVVLSLFLLHVSTTYFGSLYAWHRGGAFGIDDLGVAPGAGIDEVRDRALAAGCKLDPEDPSRMRFRLRAERESIRRFLYERFRLWDEYEFCFDEEHHLFEILRFRIGTPAGWARGGLTTWKAVDGAWELEGRSGEMTELSDPDERR